MTVKMSSLRADLDREEKGDWVPSIDIPGVDFNVSSLHLPAYRVDEALMEQRFTRRYKGKPVPPNVRTVETGKLLFKHILHGWRGLDIPYSEEAAREWMCEAEGRNVIAAVQNCAAMLSLTEIEFVEDAEKNSAAPSGGK